MSLLRRLIDSVCSNRADPPGAQASRGKVLVVDDDARLCELLRVAFTGRGYAVLTAQDGRAGVEVAHRELPDAIVLDASMPVLDGFAALKELRRRGRTSGIPVVMLTARWQQGDVVAGLRSGAQDYLTKPVAVEEVIKTVEALLPAA
jgi:DNA-binding response OmpR family regulator